MNMETEGFVMKRLLCYLVVLLSWEARGEGRQGKVCVVSGGLSVVRLRTTDRPFLVVDSHRQICNLKLTISHLGYEPFLAADVPFPLKK